MALFDKIRRASGSFLRQRKKNMHPLIGDTLHAVLPALHKFLNHHLFFKGILKGFMNGAFQSIRAFNLCNPPASGAVRGFYNQRILKRHILRAGGRIPLHKSGDRIIRSLKGAAHGIFISAELSGCHGIPPEPQRFSHIADRQGRQV
ncbi:hypothetical protein SDC9_196757 [bioreactor metagenome]|uniref:Uncharacterized protein n=1 Tax=bioreactor metagenome TaxID=1076179 RepID=A0A645ILF1_9ZZZZ